MATQTGVVLPQIRRSHHKNQFEIVEQDYDAIRVQSPRRQTVTTFEDGRSIVTPKSGRLLALEDKVTRALEQQSQVLTQQEQVAKALNDQQRMTEGLIQKAFDNREDFIENLNRVQNDRLEENTRHLLQNHINYITAIVSRLNKDIATLEEEIHNRDMAVVGTNSAVGKLEVHQVTMLQDLRSRVVRCDQALTKHSADISNCRSEITNTMREQQTMKENLKEHIHRVEAEMLTMMGELERIHGEQNTELNHMKKDTNRELALVGERNSVILNDVKATLSAFKLSIENDRDRFEERMMSLLDKATGNWKSLLEKVDIRIEENVYSLDIRMQKLEEALAYDRRVISDLQAKVETRIVNRLETHTRHHQEELAKAKREFREGFTSVHDSISNAKRVLEGKLKLQEDKLKKDISQVRKLVVLA
ncbi:protein FAM81A-like [Saccostrea echinata]|uniref:protein FAM81A-like n=1 Tax=Saccostrea echinata TaxID=191078 RepID=UPI002A817B6B|nr:protein FAM81A-like [Saccostrea echinata]